ncbi:hypothetical protein [Floricoccus penangensis]|uniref:hypothetical protein n=1 Tax=Floricoccus penangensis TaxID=1859475 RepID=UPI00203C463C|nr:hypothetical protein [Floricoccus penangensis]URZ87199.1 hypothetical protein KIW23_08965 [Floricoccus penangensis]
MKNKGQENKKPRWETLTKFSNWISGKLENVDNRKLVKYLVYFFIFLIVGIIILPLIMWVYTKIRFYTVTDRTTFSRLEFIKISLQLLGIILTFIVFQNTLAIQKTNKIERDNDKEKSNREKNYKMIHTDFVMLLDNLLKLKNNNLNYNDYDSFQHYTDREVINIISSKIYLNSSFQFNILFRHNVEIRSNYNSFIKNIEQILYLLNDSKRSDFISEKQKKFFLDLLIINLSENELILIAYSSIFDASFPDLASEIRKSYIFSNIEKGGALTLALFGDIRSYAINISYFKRSGDENLETNSLGNYEIFYKYFNDEGFNELKKMAGEDNAVLYKNLRSIEDYYKDPFLKKEINRNIEKVEENESLYFKINTVNFPNE